MNAGQTESTTLLDATQTLKLTCSNDTFLDYVRRLDGILSLLEQSACGALGRIIPNDEALSVDLSQVLFCSRTAREKNMDMIRKLSQR